VSDSTKPDSTEYFRVSSQVISQLSKFAYQHRRGSDQLSRIIQFKLAATHYLWKNRAGVNCATLWDIQLAVYMYLTFCQSPPSSWVH